ncbi:MFS transporter [Acidipropionibacterium jensenii]|uniref:MFS transporter n=1 Tax=Acidipropionibacterium jensenii TaxID=1749 RepID=UPI00110BE8B2|nr:MFS transporter [Acidipropionibacterium jensenii]QCV89095.1 MFS transporter [Acidipropionibacterium jensenii]
MDTDIKAVTRTPLRADRDYLAWLAADTSWMFGSAIQTFAMALIGYAVTGSFAQAGAISTVSTVVSMVAMVPGGVLVDRWDRRRSLIVSGLIRLLVFAAAAAAWWAGVLTVPVLYLVGIASGAVSGLFSGAPDAALKSVVGSEDLPRAVAANQGRDGAIRLAAPPLSGLLMAVSTALPFLAAAIGSALQVMCTRLIRTDLRPGRRPAEQGPAQATGWRGEALAGFSFVIRDPLLRRIVPALVCLNTGIGALYIGITLTLQGRGVPTWRIGLIDSVMAAGMLIGTPFAQRFIRTIPTGRLVVSAFVACTVIFVPVSLDQRIPLVLVSFGLLGLIAPAVNGAMGGYVQAVIPDDLQGRSMAALALVLQTLPALVPATVGFGLQHLGPGPTMAATVVLFPVAAVLMASHRALRELPTPDRWPLDTAAADTVTVSTEAFDTEAVDTAAVDTVEP